MDRFGVHSDEWSVAFPSSSAERASTNSFGRADEDPIVRFVLLHDQKNDDGIRLFFLDLWELYVKVSRRRPLRSENARRTTADLGVDITQPVSHCRHTDSFTRF